MAFSNDWSQKQHFVRIANCYQWSQCDDQSNVLKTYTHKWKKIIQIIIPKNKNPKDSHYHHNPVWQHNFLPTIWRRFDQCFHTERRKWTEKNAALAAVFLLISYIISKLSPNQWANFRRRSRGSETACLFPIWIKVANASNKFK